MNKKKLKNLVFYEEYELDHVCFVMGKDMSYFDDVINVLDLYNYA